MICNHLFVNLMCRDFSQPGVLLEHLAFVFTKFYSYVHGFTTSRSFPLVNLEVHGEALLKRKVVQSFKDYAYFKAQYEMAKEGKPLAKQLYGNKLRTRIRPETAMYLSADYCKEDVGYDREIKG